jgi:hypothetical protein
MCRADKRELRTEMYPRTGTSLGIPSIKYVKALLFSLANRAFADPPSQGLQLVLSVIQDRVKGM